ncbi:Retrovirus-related Pol polyprotein from transposon [Smittium culicis]|uniref:Retrovirus-related Pol polyprotein from transposon n=1 Tax=Smittium culicis TaxID=133412 RepID=A0A1R1YI61_9FUNG|nr:Retrovirus-related Pol polyprotein from transposon [Smittium culicis]
MDELTSKMRKLALLTQKNGLIEKRDYSNVVCFNFQKKGHNSKVCKYTRGFKTSEEYEKENNTALLAIVKEEKHDHIGMATQVNKRPRLDYLLNPEEESRELTNKRKSIVTLPKLGKIGSTKLKVKSSTKSSIPNPECSKRVLDSQVPISVRGVLSITPKLIKELNHSLNYVKRSKVKPLLYAEDLSDFSKDESESEDSQSESSEITQEIALSYLATYIDKYPIPLFIDPGASYSIIDTKLVDSLGLDRTKLKAPIKIKAVNGELSEIKTGIIIPIEFEDGKIINIPFIILDECAVPILLGLDTCQRLKAKIDYNKETFTLRKGREEIRIQIYSKENIPEAYSEQSNYLADDESVPLLYSVIDADFSGEGIPQIKLETPQNFDQPISSDITNIQREKLKIILEYFNGIFADDYSHLPGIDNSEYILETPEDTKPISSTLIEQEGKDKERSPIAYFSRKLNDVEKNYSSFEKEALALVASIKHFQCYLWGKNFDLYTDNSAVSKIYNQSDATGRVSRWISCLSEYDFDIYHREGKDNQVADFLSRPVLLAKEKAPEDIKFREINNFLQGEGT